MNDVWDDPVPEPVVSPCSSRCGVNSATGFCGGCGRTLLEIAEWQEMTKEEKIEVVKKIKERMK